MPRSRDPRPADGPPAATNGFAARRSPTATGGTGRARQREIPEAVANRMARRIAIGTGIPTLMGMGVFVGSYLLVSRRLLDVPPAVTLALSGGCFLLGLLGLSYGVLSASWEEAPGSLLGLEQLGLNLGRVRASIRAMRQGSGQA
ncbi:MAG: photosystem II biosynthesis protein [Synechococcaceae cyanobacterium]|jgi:drug/metabolite transporter (DMT)-like permease